MVVSSAFWLSRRAWDGGVYGREGIDEGSRGNSRRRADTNNLSHSSGCACRRFRREFNGDDNELHNGAAAR